MNCAPADELRAAPLPAALAALALLEGELGPEGVAALLTPREVYARHAQRFPRPDEHPSVVAYVGEYKSGKTWSAVQLFLHLIITGRARRPRIICATGSDIEGTLVDGPSGIRSWLPPGVKCEWQSSKGHEGLLWINGIKISCLSADAPGQAIGEGADVQLLDDIAKWVISCGVDGAKKAWGASQKSCSEPGALSIVPTTPDGIGFLLDQMGEGERAGMLVIDLGASENNAGNLDENFIRYTIPNLKNLGLWNPLASVSPFAETPFDTLRLDASPPLVELAVAIDPALSSHARSCDVGIVGGGRDARSTIHVRHDRSAPLDAGLSGWPSVAWDLAEQLQREHPGAPWHFVLEVNRGRKEPEALLRGEEVRRRLIASGGKHGNTVCEIRTVTSDKDKCARAVSPARLAAQGQLRTAKGLLQLEGQLRGLTPAGTDSDRADAAVHLVNDLAGLGEASVPVVDVVATFAGAAAARARMPRPAFAGRRV